MERKQKKDLPKPEEKKPEKKVEIKHPSSSYGKGSSRIGTSGGSN